MKKLAIIIAILASCNTVTAAITARKIADPKLETRKDLQNNVYAHYWVMQDIDAINTNWIALSNSPTEVALEVDDYIELSVIGPQRTSIVLHNLNDDGGNQAVIYGRYNGEVGDFEFGESGPYEFFFEARNRDGVGQHDTLWLLIDESLNGDLNNDGLLDINDINAFVPGGPQFMDMDRNGSVNESDRSYWIHTIMGTNFGDANLDKIFDSQDMVLAISGGKYEADSLATWSEGDFDGNLLFNTNDMILALQTGTYETAAAALGVPEPTNAALFFIILICCWRKNER